MEKKARLAIVINSILIFILMMSSYQFYQNLFTYNELSDVYPDNNWLGTLFYISAFTIFGLLCALVLFNYTLLKWKTVHFFDVTVVRMFEYQGAVLLTIGSSLFALELGTMHMQFRELFPSGFLGIGVSGSALIILIGLLFGFVAYILSVSKRIKDEIDLTI